MDALTEQVAFYFSDANLRRDKFLRKHVGEKGTGAVAVSLLATFNRVKQLMADDAQLLVSALRAVPGQLPAGRPKTAAPRGQPTPAATVGAKRQRRTVRVRGAAAALKMKGDAKGSRRVS